ncbi:MAG: phytanoyl-CoA dioxygenase family protein [Enhydrobacter sp.]|nr:phytanoyl-CoA dioxygenase family protein [Enhydrobacter sp.]
MTPEQILEQPARVLSQSQRERYFTEGFLVLEKIIPDDWLARLRAATEELVERSRAVTGNDEVWDLEPGHSAEAPRLRRVSKPVEQHPDFWAYVSESFLPDLVADLVGPDVKFHHSKLNFKWARGGTEVKWHQDIPFWPHTNYSPLTVGNYLYDCGPEQGPVGFIPGSHEGEIHDHYDETREWVGCLSEEAEAGIDTSRAVYAVAPAGSITLHNCRTIHGSQPNRTDLGRPLLLYTLSSADAFPYTVNPIRSRYDQAIVRGQPARLAHHDPRPCPLPPDWSGGYSSIFALQQREGRKAAAMMG